LAGFLDFFAAANGVAGGCVGMVGDGGFAPVLPVNGSHVLPWNALA